MSKGTQQNNVALDTPRHAVSARWYLWEGGFLAIGKSEGIVPPHSHHALQIVIAIDGEVGIKGARDEWRACRGLVVRQDVEHSYDGKGASAVMLFVDPESNEGVWLRTALTEDITLVPETRLTACTSALRTFSERPLESIEIGDVIRHCVSSLCAGAPPSRHLDERVTKVLTAIRESDELRALSDDARRLLRD
jgi:AraC family transcriptional regulator